MKNNSKAKRYKTNNKKKSEKSNRAKKIMLVIFLILILVIVVVYNYNGNISKTQNNNNINEHESEIKINNNPEIVQKKTVENADYLEITGLEIETKQGYSSVSTKIKNNSNEKIENISLTISILDDAGNVVAELTNPVKSIQPGETINSFGILNMDISESYNYIVKKN